MPNDFEKQVQQKMEELKLVPSEPVWQKVEMQIRRKKDRRRLLFWLPLLGLLLGGGFWYTTRSGTQQHTAQNGNEETRREKATVTEEIHAKNNDRNTTATTEIKEPLGQAKKLSKTKNNTFPATVLSQSSVQKIVQRTTKQDGFAIAGNFIEKRKVPAAKESIVSEKREEKEFIVDANEQTSNASDTISSVVHSNSSTTIADSAEMKLNAPPSIQDSIKIDSVLKEKPAGPKKHAEPKWKYAVVVNTGVSGLSRLNLFNGQKSLDFSYSPGSSPGIVLRGPSAVQKGLSLSAGLLVQKQLSHRLRFSTGLMYNYYSNSMEVGSAVRRDTTFQTDYAVSQYYTNSIAANGFMQSYQNRYHFISLLVAIDWQLLKKSPLDFHAGLSLQQLIASNALVFDYASQAYYHSNSAFNRTQLFFEFGLNYAFPLPKSRLTVGPQVQYGLGRLEKDNSKHHLFSYGLNARLQLNKK
jgi:hypothetical protein